MSFYLSMLYRLGRGRHPGVLGALTLAAVLLGLGEASATLGASCIRLFSVALLGLALGVLAKKVAGSRRSFRAAVYALPLLWLLPVGVVWGTLFPPIQFFWAAGILIYFGGMALRLARKQPLSTKDLLLAGKKSTFALGLALLVLAAAVLVTL